MNVVDVIAAQRRADLEAEWGPWSPTASLPPLTPRQDARPFAEALSQPGVSLIAEFKRSSPSVSGVGKLYELAALVSAYERGRATALSIITEPRHFEGAWSDLEAARAHSSLPILCKDFIVHPRQIDAAVSAGADAVLLMVAIVDFDELAVLYDYARHAALDVLVEVHNEQELDQALELDADVIGVNNRGWPETHDVSGLDRTYDLQPAIPAGKTLVSESGIASPRQVEELELIGVDAILVGTSLLQAADPEAACRALTGAGSQASTQ